MSKKLSKSPERWKFQKEIIDVADIYQNLIDTMNEREENLDWQKNNLEYDLRTTDWILEKARCSRVYSQHLYAAMCNNDFQKLEVMPILKEETWGCSWRSAGGIVANMREDGDYIDWYCSGIKDDEIIDEEEWNWTEEQHLRYRECKSFVGEGIVTDEIREDLKKLGWIVLDSKDDE